MALTQESDKIFDETGERIDIHDAQIDPQQKIYEDVVGPPKNGWLPGLGRRVGNSRRTAVTVHRVDELRAELYEEQELRQQMTEKMSQMEKKMEGKMEMEQKTIENISDMNQKMAKLQSILDTVVARRCDGDEFPTP